MISFCLGLFKQTYGVGYIDSDHLAWTRLVCSESYTIQWTICLYQDSTLYYHSALITRYEIITASDIWNVVRPSEL